MGEIRNAGFFGMKTKNIIPLIFFGAVLVGLFFTTFVNNLLFHSLAEIFSIVVAFSFLIITWTSQNYIKIQYVLFTGIAYLSVPYETTSTCLSRTMLARNFVEVWLDGWPDWCLP